MLKNTIQIAILSLIFAMILTAFALSNTQSVNVSLLIWSGNAPISMVILVSILIGVIFTGVIAAAEELKMLRQIKELEGKITAMESTPKV